MRSLEACYDSWWTELQKYSHVAVAHMVMPASASRPQQLVSLPPSPPRCECALCSPGPAPGLAAATRPLHDLTTSQKLRYIRTHALKFEVKVT